MLKRYGAALILVTKELSIYPEDISLHSFLSLIYCELKQYDNAKDSAEKVVMLEPNLPEGFLLLGLICQAKNNNKKGLYYAEKAFSVAPEEKECLVRLAEMQMLCRKFKAAENTVAKLIKIEPNEERAWSILASLSIKSKDYIVAEEQILNALKLNPECAIHLGKLGEIYLKQKKYLDALRIYTAALAYSPDNFLLKCDLRNSVRRHLKSLSTLKEKQEVIDNLSKSAKIICKDEVRLVEILSEEPSENLQAFSAVWRVVWVVLVIFTVFRFVSD